MTRPFRIAVTADPELPVPPIYYGGIERVIHLLVAGLTARGHEVVLFGHRDSKVPCELVAYPGTTSRSVVDSVRNMAAIAARVVGGGFDIVHSFGRLAYLAPLARHPVRKIMSYQRAITPSSVSRARRLFGDTIHFTACSRHMIGPVESLATWHVVYNGVPVGSYPFQARVDPDAPLVFVGRLEAIKGPHLAIEAARRAGRRLILAGNVEPAHRPYFEAAIRPFLDGASVAYVGPVDDREKSALLGRAAALLMPILWDEPFGIVMAEALACGTPVVGLRRGSVPEVVRHGTTGFVCDDVDGLVQAIACIDRIDRAACRADAERRFSDSVVVSDYEALYARCLRAPEPAPAARTAGWSRGASAPRRDVE